jgi:gamma-glutamyltranspeptidase
VDDEREYHPRMHWTNVTVTVDEKHLDAIEEVADRLRERGMRVDQVMASIGIVTGSIEDVDALRGVTGVESVAAEERVDLGPPDQEIQ